MLHFTEWAALLCTHAMCTEARGPHRHVKDVQNSVIGQLQVGSWAIAGKIRHLLGASGSPEGMASWRALRPQGRGSSRAKPYPSHDVGIQRDFICLIWVAPKPHRMVALLPVHLAVGAALQRRPLSSQSRHCHAKAARHEPGAQASKLQLGAPAFTSSIASRAGVLEFARLMAAHALSVASANQVVTTSGNDPAAAWGSLEDGCNKLPRRRIALLMKGFMSQVPRAQ